MNNVEARSNTVKCSRCGAELRLDSVFCKECVASLERTSSWPDKPWLYIWIKPRSTIREIIDSDPENYVLVLAILAGIVETLDNASSRNFGDTLGFAGVLVVSLLVGAIGGVISLYIAGAIFRWTGSWFGGQASSEEIRAAFAWSAVPVIVMLLFWIPLLAMYGNDMFSSMTPKIDSNPYILLFSTIPFLVLSLWTLVLLVLTISEVHRFSMWKAIATLAIPLLVLIIPALGCGLLMGMN